MTTAKLIEYLRAGDVIILPGAGNAPRIATGPARFDVRLDTGRDRPREVHKMLRRLIALRKLRTLK